VLERIFVLLGWLDSGDVAGGQGRQRGVEMSDDRNIWNERLNMKSLETRHVHASDSSEPSSQESDSIETRYIRVPDSPAEHPAQEEGSLATHHIGVLDSPAPSPAREVGSLETRHMGVPGPSTLPPTQESGPVEGAPPVPAKRERGTQYMAPPSQPAAQSIEGRLPDGHMLQNRYRILELHAVGGMSTVYKAQDLRFTKVTRLCIIKEMLNTATDPQVRAMVKSHFEREANILAALNHPCIVQVYDFFSEGARNYLVLEFVDGKDLEDILNETDGFLSEAQVVNWAIQVCEVLSYLHSHDPQPIVFRDIKPSNIMLDSHGRIRLIDFGIARIFQSGQKGTMIGTEGYTPPEQYRGSAEPRVDIYALGATMHHLLSKQDPKLEAPFSFQDRPIHRTNPTVSRELTEIINKALEYDIDKRYGSAEEMQRALAALSSARIRGGTAAFGTAAFMSSDVMALWRFRCEDEIRSSPAVHNGVVYIGSYDHNLYALDADTGEFMWKYATEGGIASSPCVYEGRVFFGSADRLLYALNAETGRIAWTCPTQGSVWSSPHAAFDHVFFGSDDNNLYAVNTYSGRVAWRFAADGQVRSSPAVANDTVYVGCEGGGVYAVDISGQVRWRYRAKRGITSSPAFTDEMVYVGCQDAYVYALDIRSGWSAWRQRTSGPVVSSPVVSHNLVFVGSVDKYLYALDANSGRVVWRYATEGQVASNPAVAGDAVYFGSADGMVYSLDVHTGNVRWRFQTEGPVVSSPTVVNDIVYIGSDDRYMYALPA
jgi:outer membrane protein assembly factor BamB/tRNA A-37 threonylcarbamoyl transferase component Bud32